MIHGDYNTPSQPGPASDDDLLQKNRINALEIDEESRSRNIKKPILIISSIAVVLIAGILVAVTFFYKKPQIFKPLSKEETIPFDSIERDFEVQSENVNIIRGRDSYRKGYLTDAISEFNEVVESGASDRDKAIALTYLGMISDDRGEYDRAIEYFSRAITYDRNNPDTYKYMSTAFRHKKDYQNAVTYAKKALSLRPNDIDTMTLMGNIYFEVSEYEEAADIYHRVLKVSPENPPVLYNLASALLKTGDEFAAVEYLKKAATFDRIGDVAHRAYNRLGTIYMKRNDYKRAEEMLKQAVNIRPGDPRNRYNLGVALMKQGRKDRAAEELREAERLGEKDTDMLENVGDAYLTMKDYDRGLETFEKLADLNSRNVRVLSRLGEIYYEQGNLDRAYEAYRKIATIEPATENARVAWLNMGSILDDTQRYGDAIDAYEKALTLDPKDHRAWYLMGISYKNANQPEGAIRAWKKASELKPSDPAPRIAVADYYYQRGFYDLAETGYQEIANRWPEIQEPHYKIANLYFKRGDYRYALKAYQRVAELNSSSEMARKSYVNIALITAKLGQDEGSLERSRDLIQKALLMKPGDPETLLALGIIYSKMAMHDNAIDTFYQVLKSTTDTGLLAEAYNNIGKSYYEKKQYKKAMQSFTRGIEEDPTNEEIRMNRKVAMQAYERQLGEER